MTTARELMALGIPPSAARMLHDRFIDKKDEGVFSALSFNAVGNGKADDTPALQTAIDAAYAQGGGTVLLRAGTYMTTGLTLKESVTLVGAGKNATIIKLLNGANEHVIQAGEFDTYANGVDRSTPVGCKTGGLRRLSLDGNKANQALPKHGLAYYGVDLQLDEVEIKNAKGVGLYVEAPGAAYSTVVGRNLQTNIRHVEVHHSGIGNIYYNGQSDSTGIDIMAYETDNGAGSYHIKFGNKSTGVRWFGVHTWGLGEWGWINEATTAGLYTSHMERPVWLLAPTYFTGRLYYGNTTSDRPAFVVEGTAGGSDIEARVTGYKYGVKFPTIDQGASLFRLRHFSALSGSAILDPSGGPFAATTLREFIASNAANDDEFSFGGPVRSVTSANSAGLAGAATGQRPRIEFTGTDVTVNAAYACQGGGGHGFYSDTGLTLRQFNIEHQANAVHSLAAVGGATGVAGPQLLVRSSETDADLRLVPKGSGRVRVGPHVASADAPITGYIEVKDSAGVLRKLAVVA
jgi:hypothetical protein